MVQMVPTEKPQPDAMQYGLSELELFPRLTRAEYKTRFSEQAPAYNSPIPNIPADDQRNNNRRIQRWYDSSAASLDPNGLYTYKIYVAPKDGVQQVALTLTNAEAAWPNMPGAFDFQKWVPAPIGATVQSATGEPTQLTPDTFATVEQMQALISQLKAAFSIKEDAKTWIESWEGPFQIVYTASEKRRKWWFQLGNQVYNAGLLLADKWRNGINSPGKWVMGDFGAMWQSQVSTDNGQWDSRPEVAIPMRDTYPTERFAQVFGGEWVIQRIDAPGTTTLDDTAAVPTRVRDIYTRVLQMQKDIKTLVQRQP